MIVRTLFDTWDQSLKMLSTISRLSDEARINLLKSLEDPIDTLEGKNVKLSNLIFKPQLLREIVKF